MVAARRSRTDDGFTLIELMVVVLIIAILLAIAIPTFLGARERANDRATQSNLRNAHTNELVYSSDNNPSAFTATVSDLEGLDESLDWTATRAHLTGRPGSVYVELAMVGAQQAVVVGSMSRPRTCFWLRAVANEDHPRFAEDDCLTVDLSTLDFQPRW